MSLFGALSSGVSGLTAQSSAMGAISDNITNVSTVGYKSTTVNFASLVTKQTSGTFYSAGGVQSKPRQDTGIQGLLQASTSSTDIAISGQGFFVVNEASEPTVDDAYLYTRAGSFFMDNDGYLRNTSGYYLQGWPVDAAGVVKPANPDLTIANQNIVSSDYCSTVNLSRVGGTATSTEKVAIGANLPSDNVAGTTHKTDIQFFDSLGNANTMSIEYEKSGADNEWLLRVEPPQGTTHITMEDSILSPKVYRSIGQLEFNKVDATGASRRPADGASMTIREGSGTALTYVFDNDDSVTNAVAQVSTVTIATSGDIDANDVTVVTVGGTAITTTYGAGETVATIAADIATNINANATTGALVSATASAGVVTITAKVSGATGFTIATSETDADGDMTSTAATPTAAAGTDNTFKVDTSDSATMAGDVTALLTAIRASNSNMDTTNNRVNTSAGSTTTVLFEDDGINTIVIDPTGLKDSTGADITEQSTSFTVSKRDTLYTDQTQIKFTAVPANADTIVINSLTYTFTTGQAEDTTGADRVIYRDGPLDRVLADLEDAIETNDPQFADGTVLIRGSDSPNNNTLVLTSLTNGNDFTVVTSGLTSAPTEPDGSTTVAASIFTSANTITVGTNPAISFSSDGLPNIFNIAELDIRNFANGSANMDDDAANAKQITLDFGTVAEANGVTQFGSTFTPVFINQNGSRFGTFAGVTVGEDGLVTALFDNGETRTIYKLPVATFVNVNELEGRSGGVWNATEASGDYTLRVADNGKAGQTIQNSLETSTVDIGEEFTDMIVVQRAYSASAKIISTADQMLEELMRVKR
jgi:flagellar hook protein FlgE